MRPTVPRSSVSEWQAVRRLHVRANERGRRAAGGQTGARVGDGHGGGVSEQREARAAAHSHRTVSNAKEDELDAHWSVSPPLRSTIYALIMLCRTARPHTARGIQGHQSVCGWHDRAPKIIWVHTRRRTCSEKVCIDSLILMSCANRAAAPSRHLHGGAQENSIVQSPLAPSSAEVGRGGTAYAVVRAAVTCVASGGRRKTRRGPAPCDLLPRP